MWLTTAAWWRRVALLQKLVLSSLFVAGHVPFFRHLLDPPALQPKWTTLVKMNGRSGVFTAVVDIVWMWPKTCNQSAPNVSVCRTTYKHELYAFNNRLTGSVTRIYYNKICRMNDMHLHLSIDSSKLHPRCIAVCEAQHRADPGQLQLLYTSTMWPALSKTSIFCMHSVLRWTTTNWNNNVFCCAAERKQKRNKRKRRCQTKNRSAG